MEADATDWQLCSAGVCCHARGSNAEYCDNAMPDLAPTGSQLDHLLVTQRRRRRHRRPRKRQRVRAKEWREKMVKARRVRRALAIHNKQQQQQPQQAATVTTTEDAQADVDQMMQQMYSADQRYLAAQAIATEALANVSALQLKINHLQDQIADLTRLAKAAPTAKADTAATSAGVNEAAATPTVSEAQADIAATSAGLNEAAATPTVSESLSTVPAPPEELRIKSKTQLKKERWARDRAQEAEAAGQMVEEQRRYTKAKDLCILIVVAACIVLTVGICALPTLFARTYMA